MVSKHAGPPPLHTPASVRGEGEVAVTSSVLADWLGLSARAVQQHAKDGVLPRNAEGSFDLQTAVLAYCKHMRAVAAGRGGAAQSTLTAERARLAREQADACALKNAVTRGELVEVAEAERAWADTMRQVRSCLLAVPSRVRQRLGHLTVADVEVIDREVRDALTEAGDIVREGGNGPPPK